MSQLFLRKPFGNSSFPQAVSEAFHEIAVAH
jgi:hypothetical protein